MAGSPTDQALRKNSSNFKSTESLFPIGPTPSRFCDHFRADGSRAVVDGEVIRAGLDDVDQVVIRKRREGLGGEQCLMINNRVFPVRLAAVGRSWVLPKGGAGVAEREPGGIRPGNHGGEIAINQLERQR